MLNDGCSFIFQLWSNHCSPRTIICALHPIVVYTWTIFFYNVYINFHLCRILCQKAGSLFQDHFSVFQVYFYNRTFLASLQRFNFKVTFLGFPLDSKLWQSCTNPGSAGASISSRMLSTLVSKWLSLTLGGMPCLKFPNILS